MQCKHLKSDNTRCEARALTGDEFCFAHSPEVKEQRELANSKGGQHSYKTIQVSKGLHPLKTPSDIVLLLEATINEVRVGKLDVKIANCVGYLSSHFLKAYEFSDLEERVADIEKILAKNIKN